MTQVPADAPELGVPDASKWWIPVVIGVLSVIIGFAALVWPGITLLVTGLLFGWMLIFAGAGNLAVAFHKGSSLPVKIAGGLLGALTIFVGTVLLFRPGASVLTAAWVLGFWFVVTGVVQLIQGISHHESRIYNILFGLIGIVAGGIILGSPQIGLATLVLITGIGFLMRGVMALALGFAVRSIHKKGGPTPGGSPTVVVAV